MLYAAALPAFLDRPSATASFGGRSWAGAWLVFFPMVVTWVCDSAAMSAGRAIGGAEARTHNEPGEDPLGGIDGVIGGLLVAPIFCT